MFEAPPKGAVVRFDELSPTWTTMHAREPGHMRWLVTYYGGAEGYINENRETDLVSDRTVTGMMWLGAGNRQFGVHEHTVTEIYVILKGQVESIEPGRRQLAGPLDCLYMPPGAPHAVRAVGDEDVLLLWFHDENEEIGKSQYYDEGDSRWSSATPAVQHVRWADLQPNWSAPGARTGGTMRWWASWAGAAAGEFAIDPAVGAPNKRVGLGATMIPPGNAHVPHAHPFAEHYVVLSGRAAVHGADPGRILGPNDYVGFAAGQVHGLRAVGTEPLQVLWLQEETGVPGTTYEERA
jgi:mannose-6-phosphate isomerase-like protein (cupin superfamily)